MNKWILLFLISIYAPNLSAQIVPLYGLFERKLVNTNNYNNPFLDVDLDVIYTSPSGKKLDFFGFHDGDGSGGQNGKIWKIRFMPDEVGTWTYRYSWSDGTNGDTGSFHATSEGVKSGPWRINENNSYWLTDSHGKTFLPIALYAHSHLTPIDWQDAIHWAKSREYNTIVTPTLNISEWGDGWTNTTAFAKAYGDPQGSASGSEKVVDPFRYNLKMWKEWDDMIREAGDNGIYIGPFEGPSGKYGGREGKYPPKELAFQPKIRERFDTTRNKRFIKYFVARQGAFWNLAYWSLGGTEVFRYSVSDEAEFQAYINYLASLTPWGRMITAQDCEQWHDKERRWLSRSSIPASRKLNALQTSVSSSNYPHWGGNDINNRYWQEARPNNELALDSYAGFPMICTECLWEGQGRAEKPLRIIWGMLTAGAHTVWADWRYGDEVSSAEQKWGLIGKIWTYVRYGGEHKWGSIGRAWTPIKPLNEHVFKTTQLGVNTTGDKQLKRAIDLLSTLDYWRMRPHNEVVSGSKEAYCLAELGHQYLIYAPTGGPVLLKLPLGTFHAGWFDPRDGSFLGQQMLSGVSTANIRAPTSDDWVLVVTYQGG